ncbi:hypothetical protein HPE56_04170 [Maribacter sp. ANRC-HE7]|uniref:Uncharacterized protein n=1 Tax=Maribacter aquimaris TaxID=2737171 RepID=A0ABR7UXQ9_9FLAO|nr:hypothetical protein [Maribacter aquimaris]MBD0776981.1 hypothetical protein [Maribacter aquimaris]
MKINHLYIILFLCCGLLSANANNSPFACTERSRSEGGACKTGDIKHLLESKDTIPATEKDTTKTLVADKNHLAHLQQMATMHYGNTQLKPFGKTPRSNATAREQLALHRPQGDNNTSGLKEETAKTLRSFPMLDQKLAEGQNFNISFADREPEFTPEFIAANFEKNPAAEKFIKNAKGALDAVKELGNFVDVLTGKELLELPVGLKKKDSTSGNTVELAVAEVKFTPGYALLKVWGRMIIPEKGEFENEEDRGVERELFFGAENVKLSHEGGLSGDMKLVLLGDQAVPIQGDNWLLTLKGGIDLENGTFTDQSYIEFSCSDLKGISLEGDLRISRNVLLPITSGGNYVCGDSPDNKYLKDSDVVNNKCYVGAEFSIKANGWNDLFVEVSLPKFEIRGLKGWGFNVKRAVLDLSDSRNASSMKFPKDYSEVLIRGQRELWRGFYAKEVSVMLPKGIEDTKKSNGRVEFGAQDLILDSQGVSGTFFGENILQTGDGAAGKWAFTIDDISISLSRNSLIGGSIGGDIAVPIFEKPMDYEGYIAPDNYGLEVGLNSNYKTPVFLGEMQLERNSSVAINVIEGNVYPYANLTGKLAIAGKINQKEGDTTPPDTEDDKKGFAFNGISFQELELQTEPGKKPIQAKSFGYEGEMNLMGFPASIGDLQLVDTNNQVGLDFDLKINLDGDGSYATTSMAILGKLEDGAKIQEWKFERVKVNGIDIDYTKGNLNIKGALEVMEDDPTYGDGFAGELTASFEKLKFSANGKAMFGKTDFRYWFVDIWSDTKKGEESKFLINSFVGGVSYKMRKTRGNSDGFTPSSAVYTPDNTVGLGLRAGVKISTKNSDTFNGKAYLEMVYNTHGGLNRIGFIGEGAFMGDNTTGSSTTSDFGALNKTLEKVNDFYEKNKDKAEKYSKYADYLPMAKEAIPLHDVAASGKIGAFVGIEKDFENDSFKGEFEIYLDLEGVKGGGDNNLAGYASIYTSPNDWHVYIGTPQKRIELLFQVGVQLRVGGYFMTGTDLPMQLDPHPMVVKILGDDMLNGNRQENQLTSGKGFAFGMNFAYGYNFDYLIFYAFVELGAGFDVMHAYYPDAKCVGRPGPIGNNGWYSMGQVYAYLYGEFGVKVNLTFIKGKFKIAEAGVAAMLRGQFPNPAYFQGYVGMYYKILGGLVKGRMRLKVEVGEECELVGINNAVGVPMISDVTPRDKSDDVSVFAAPQAVFNYAANHDFTVDLEDGRRTFKLQLKNFTVTSEGQQLEGELEWNDTNDAVTFKPAETLPSEKEVKVVVEVSFDEKIGGTYQTMTENGNPVIEKQEATFTTDLAPDHIPLENIAYMYPVMEQQNFYPEEYDKGYVKMITPQNYLFNSGYEMRAEFSSTATGQGIRTKLSYDQSKATVFYDVPEMTLGTPYKLNLMAFPPGADIQTEIIVEETELFADQESGDTNWFDVATNSQDKETITTSSSAVVSNKKAANVTVSNGAPKSILEYDFKTSKHASFKDKVRDLTVINNLTNYIYADVHSLSIKVADYEYFEKLEVSGGKYTALQPLVYAQAILDDDYYKKKIYPLLYENYPLDGNIYVDRDESILGVPPIRSFYVGQEYLANLENNPGSSWVKNRIPFVYNLPYQYKSDMVHLRNRIINRYSYSDGNTEQFNTFKYLLTSFPPLPLGSFKAQLIYRTPGNLYQKGYQIKYKND